MPTEQSQLEYYHYYRASQRRVQQWVQRTSRELEAAAGRSPSDLRGLNDDDDVEGNNVEEDAGSGGCGNRRRKSSRRRSSPSSKHHAHMDNSSRSRGPSSPSRKKKKVDDHDVRRGQNSTTRSRKPDCSSDGLAIFSSLLPFGLFPLLFALTPPSVATLFSATILLAGYFCVDYSKQELISEKL